MKTYLAIALLFVAAVHAGAQSQHSLVIGVDGMGFGTYGFSNVSTPNMDSLINGTWQAGYNGAYANNAFSGGILGTATQQQTVSGPSWSSILTGVWVDRHNVLDNGSTFQNQSGDYHNNNTYLEMLEENVAGIVTGSFVAWDDIHFNIIPSITDADSAIDVDMVDNGNDANVTSAAIGHVGSISTNAPSATFVHLLDVDLMGHSTGSDDVRYGNAITIADARVGQLLDAVSGRANFENEDWQIIIIADHGHRAAGGHGGQSDIERTVPLIISSSSAIQGGLLGADQPVSIVDVAPTVLTHFDLSVPGNMAGVSRDVPEPSSLISLVLGGLMCMRPGRKCSANPPPPSA